MEKKANKRVQQREETLERIRLAIDNLVPRVGYEKLTIRDICKESNITVGTFYHYFSSKDDIILDRYKRTNRSFKDLYEIKVKHLDAIEALQEIADYYIEYIKSRVLEVLVEYQRVMASNSGKYEDIEENAIRLILKDIIRSGLEEETIKNKYTEDQITEMIWCIFSGIARMHCLTNGELLNKDDSIKNQLHDVIENLRKVDK